jgi:hypothetical protein
MCRDTLAIGGEMSSGGNGGVAAVSNDTDETGPGRRSLLRAGVLGGGAVAALGVGGLGGAARALASGGAAATQPPFRLFAQEDMNFETLFALGSAGYGCSEVGEVVTTVNRINAQGATYQTYYDGFLAMARSVEAIADRELRAGHTASARSAFLRAAMYYDM